MFIIAEIAQAHDGSLGLAHAYVEALADSGVSAVKFQVHLAHAESSEFEPFRTKFSYEDASRYDYWRRMAFSEAQWIGLKNHCEEVGLEFMASPFSNAAVDLLERLAVKRYKIGSGEVSNDLILEKIARTKKPILLSSGMSSYEELDHAVEFLKPRVAEICVMQCTTSYPTKAKDWGLNVIPELQERYQLPVGFSDHSGDIFASFAAATMGAEVLEFHVVFDQRMFGPDATSSLNLSQVKQLTKGLSQLAEAGAHPIDKTDNARFTDLKNIFEKSLAVNRDLPCGHVLAFEDLEAKKPKGRGLDAVDYKKTIGQKLKQDLKAWSFLNATDLDD